VTTLEQLGVTADLGAGAGFKALWSLLAILAVFALRWALVRAVRGGAEILTDRQRWWISLIKNLATAALFAGLVAIWADEIKAFALSIAAVAVAFVIATKELWLCVTGATWRGASQAFSVGDWIEIGPHSGEVIEENLLATVLQEIDPHDFSVTGRIIWAPNSLLLTAPIINNGFGKRFIYFQFDIYTEPHTGAAATMARIRDALDAATVEFHELARRYAARIERSAGAKLRDPAPRVTAHTTDLAKIAFRCAVFCPRERAAAVRAAVMAAYLDGGPPPPGGEMTK